MIKLLVSLQMNLLNSFKICSFIDLLKHFFEWLLWALAVNIANISKIETQGAHHLMLLKYIWRLRI